MDGSLPPRVRSMRIDGALGSWTLALATPRPDLAGCIAQLWYGEGRVAYQRDRILPSGRAFVLVNLGPVQYRIEPGPPERRVAFDDIWYVGPHAGPIDTEAPQGNALLGVEFLAHGSHGWLGEAAAGLADRIVPLADVLGEPARRLREELRALRDPLSRFARVEDFLAARIGGGRATHPDVIAALSRLEASAGAAPVASICRELGISRKHLAELFREQVGQRPKTLARVLRFRSAMALLDGATTVPWAEFAMRCGYYDQAHLARDFRDFAGLSPGGVLKLARPDGNSVVLR